MKSGNVTGGYLTGVLNADTKVPSGSFILATKDNTQAFFKVETSNYTAALNKCFITAGASDARVLRFADSGVETSIESLNAENEAVTGSIFNLAGQKMNAVQKGINIVNGKKVLVK